MLTASKPTAMTAAEIFHDIYRALLDAEDSPTISPDRLFRAHNALNYAHRQLDLLEQFAANVAKPLPKTLSSVPSVFNLEVA